MPGYFTDFLIRWRISQCGKQVVSDIQTLAPEQGCHLALMVALLRATTMGTAVPGSYVILNDVLQHPTAFRKELSYAAFCFLREIRESSREKMRSYASFNIVPDPIVVEHTEMCDLALGLLMSTVGLGYHPSTLSVVQYAWKDVTAFSPTDADVAVVMTMPEYIINDIIVQPLETAQWLELARKLPDFIKSEA